MPSGKPTYRYTLNNGSIYMQKPYWGAYDLWVDLSKPLDVVLRLVSLFDKIADPRKKRDRAIQ